MELVKVKHAVVGWQMINATDYQPEIHGDIIPGDSEPSPPEAATEEAPEETETTTKSRKK